VLKTLDEPTDLVMKGLPSIPSRVGPVARPRCYLYRTNAGAVACLLNGLDEKRRGHLIGGGGDVVDFVKAAVSLQAGRPTSHPELACFGNWAEVEEYSKTDEGSDLKLMVKLIKEFGAEKILSALENMPGEASADFVVSTAHKSKGREWASVKLGSDFPTADKMGDSDARLLYVALTRAQEELDLTECPPFAGGRTDEGKVAPTITVRYTASMPTEDDLVQYRAKKRADDRISDHWKNVVTTPTPAPTSNGQANGTAAGDFSWANLGDGWLVRGPKVDVGARVVVTRKNGSKSTETVKKVEKQLGALWFYRV
jgi:hypothetical protein